MSIVRAAGRRRSRARRTAALLTASACCTAALIGAGPATAATPGFAAPKTLAGAAPANPTSLQFGPDGRLYVSEQQGAIWAYTVERSGGGTYSVKSAEKITAIQAITNHNDDGSVAPANAQGKRLVTGIAVRGTAAKPEVWVTSSDARIAVGYDSNLDTNSGILTKLTKTDAGWKRDDLVRGLPRSEENHTANGLAFSKDGTKVYLAQGGNTNNGGTSLSFGWLPEYALSAAILSVDLTKLPASGPYDIPTLAGTGVFGGNNGQNQAKLVPGGPVQVHAPGFRNPYDVVVTQAGEMFTIDNGGNADWGDAPVGEGPGGTCTNARSDAKGSSNPDELFRVEPGTYGGHPNPTRANEANTSWYSFEGNLLPGSGTSPVTQGNAEECDFKTWAPTQPSAHSGSLKEFYSSTNGLAEYTASNFGGAMKGDLVTTKLYAANGLYRLEPGATTAKETKIVANAAPNTGPLDVTVQGDDGTYPGTIWYGDAFGKTIHVAEPNDFAGGAPPCDLSDTSADPDKDGFSTGVENELGTDPCGQADAPGDLDGDKKPDAKDPDDDGDTLPDLTDPFALDAANGLATKLPASYQWENDGPAAGGILNTGFTGLMTNSHHDYSTMFEPSKMTVIGAAGDVTVDEVDNGDAFVDNQQKYGFQFGVNARPEVGPFNVHTRLVSPFTGEDVAEDFQSMGMFIGTGDQQNYLKVVVGSNGGPMLQVLKEEKGVASMKRYQFAFGAPAVDLFLRVDPAAGTVQPSYTTTDAQGRTSAPVKVGDPVPVPKAWFTAPTGLAVGIISTSSGTASPFPASWDLIEVMPEGTPGTDIPKTPTGPGPIAQPKPGPAPDQGGKPAPPVGDAGGIPPAATDRTRPVVGSLKLGSRSFRTTGARRGTTVRLTLSERASVRLSVEVARKRAGRTRYVAIPGTLTRTLATGQAAVRLTGTIGGKRLKPGRYRLVVTATDTAGNRSQAKRVAFTVVR